MTPLALAGLDTPELPIILAVALLLFGGSRLAGLGKSSSRAIRAFKDETAALDTHTFQPLHNDVHRPANRSAAPPLGWTSNTPVSSVCDDYAPSPSPGCASHTHRHTPAVDVWLHQHTSTTDHLTTYTRTPLSGETMTTTTHPVPAANTGPAAGSRTCAPRRRTAWAAGLAACALSLALTSCAGVSTEQQLETRQGAGDMYPPPEKGATCTAGTDKLVSCWTAIGHLDVQLKVTQKNKQNPTYSLVDEDSGQIVASGRFFESDSVVMQNNWTLRIRGPLAGQNVVTITDVVHLGA